MIDARIVAYLTRRIEAIRGLREPRDRSLQKSTFMLEASTFAEAGLMTHDERFEWTARLLREVP